MPRFHCLHYVTLALFLGLFGLPLVYEGGFFDGIHYAIISQNLAHNTGDFWHLKWLNNTPFSGHPPLFFFMESLFFRLFGDGFWVGNAFIFTLAIAVLIILHLCLQELAHLTYSPINKKHSWVILLLWISAGHVAWGFNNNAIETLLTFWTLLSFYAILKYYHTKSSLKYFFFLLASGTVFCAYLTKGPVGLYPLATPFLYGLAFHRKSLYLYFIHSLCLSLLTASYFLILLCSNDAALGFLKQYHQVQIVATLSLEKSYFYGLKTVMFHIFKMQALSISISVIAYLCAPKKHRALTTPVRNGLLFLLSVALSASLPVAVSSKFFSYYLIPSAPIFAIAFGYLILYWIGPLLERWHFPYRRSLIIMSILCCCTLIIIGIVSFGKISASRNKEKELITLSWQLKDKIPPESIIYTEKYDFHLLPAGLDTAHIVYEHPYAYTLRRNNRIYLYFLENTPEQILAAGSDAQPPYLLLKNERISYFKRLLQHYTCIATTAHLSVWSYKPA